MTEITRLLAEHQELFTDASGGLQHLMIPAGVREVIRQRLNRLSESYRQILVIASLIGREFNLQLLVLLNPRVSEEELLAMLDESLDAHLIDEVSDCGEGYYFSHALIQEVLAGELSGARRVRCHAQIGEAVEQLYAANLRAHATELAHHFARAQPVLGSEKIVRYFRLAGEEALAASSEPTGSGLAPLVEADNLERAFSSEPVPKTGFSTTPVYPSQPPTPLMSLWSEKSTGLRSAGTKKLC